jgi:hypothetical protein
LTPERRALKGTRLSTGKGACASGGAYPGAVGIARNHHTLPAFYLKRFADDKGLLSKWDRANNKWGPIRPKSPSVEVDFYIVETEQGPSDVGPRADAS